LQFCCGILLDRSCNNFIWNFNDRIKYVAPDTATPTLPSAAARLHLVVIHIQELYHHLILYNKNNYIYKKNNTSRLLRKAIQYWVDRRKFVRGINKLCGSLKDDTTND